MNQEVRAFATSSTRPSRLQHTHSSFQHTQLADSKNPVDQLKNLLESTAASVQDYILMQPKRNIPSGLRRVQTQFIAALGDPNASSSETGAETWGIWRIDPGPRGVHISQYSTSFRNGKAPAGWQFDHNDFWIEEYGRIMEKPSFPLPAGEYLVTGAREVTTVLTIGEPNSSGQQSWALQDGTLYDVTHLPCRSARYEPFETQKGSPALARLTDFPVRPGAEMPSIQGCNKRDYAVLFVLAVET